MLWMFMPTVGSCQSMPLTSTRSSAGPIAIRQPVGVGPLARNRADDVRVIQDALNRVTVKGAAGGPIPFLAVDGICGRKTNAAISRFQQAQFKIFDGVIEPNKKTIIKLNEIIDPVSDDDVKAKVRAALPIVGQAISAALLNLQAIISSGPASTGPAASAADRLDRHFKLNSLSQSDQSTARVDLFRSYTRFFTAIMRPELFDTDVLDEFDLDKKNPKISLVRRKGFFEPNKDENGVRLDHIHLGLGFFAQNVTPEFAAFIIIHELTHFVGRSDGKDIEDHGRGWFDDTFIKPLSADQRLTNADSYATFAHECRVGSSLKPSFVETAPGGLGGAR